MNQITIYELLPLLRPGWVAKGGMGHWTWFSKKPTPYKDWRCYIPQASDEDCCYLDMFNITPFDGDWEDSLMECGK